MAWVADASLAAAVSNAGGLGLISSINAGTEAVRNEIRKCKELTDKPFGVNIMLQAPNAGEIAKMVVEEGVKILTTGAGSPAQYMEEWKAAGIKVIPVIASVALALKMQAIGATAVVAEGAESGGHVGELNTMPLVPQVVDALDIPVIAAGGICDGRGVAAALMLGADGVQVGTRFLCAEECTVNQAYKDKILKAIEGSKIEITGVYWYGGEASLENVEMLRPKAADADMIFAVGGGKAIDTCKVLAHDTKRPFFTFPTIASTCAACTSLGIVYHPDGSLREYSFSKIPPNHIFIDTEIIANAPVKYLWAGMGDTMAKHYECTISSRNDTPLHSDAMGIALSTMCAGPVIRWGRQAMTDCEAHRASEELTEVVLAIIVSTGFVSNFVQVDYTTGMAHALYNGFTILPAIEANHHLHGEIVSYGILVMLTVDKQYEERDKVLAFNKSIGLPTRLADIDVTPGDLPAATEKALQGIDVRVYPYEVTQQMLIDGVKELEELQK